MSRANVQLVFRTVKQSRKIMVGVGVMMTLVIFAIFGPLMTSGNPMEVMRFRADLPPSPDHPLGTDTLGRDILQQLAYGLGQSLFIGVVAGTISLVIGVLVGFIAGYLGGTVDVILSAIMDLFIVIPTWPILVTVGAYFRVLSVPLMATLLAMFSWARPARTYKAQVMSLKNREFINMARLDGQNSLEIVIKEILPNMLSYVGVLFISAISGAMMAEVGLELIGLGPQNSITLGLMLHMAQVKGALVKGMLTWLFMPIFLLVLIFLSLNLINLGLEDVYNPRLRSR